MKKCKPDKAERVARKLVKRRGTELYIAGIFVHGFSFSRDARRAAKWWVGDLAAGLRKAGVKGR